MKLHWRPHFFSAVGAGFSSDPYLNKGIHLRWMLDPRLGLPHRSRKFEKGYFLIKSLNIDFPCLSEVDLFKLHEHTSIPIHCDFLDNKNSQLSEVSGDGIYFVKDADPKINLAAVKLLQQLQLINKDLIDEKDKLLVEYLEGVFNGLKSDLAFFGYGREIGEVCAIDMHFAIDMSISFPPIFKPNFPRIIRNRNPVFNNQTYAQVIAYDKQGRIIDQDWIGKYKSIFQPSNQKYKMNARLRAPGIYKIKVKPVRGMPRVIRNQTCWVFCEEYINAKIWDRNRGNKINFNIEEDDYHPDLVKSFYSPFKKSLDWGETTEIIKEHILSEPNLKKMWELPTTFEKYHESLPLETSFTEELGSTSFSNFPIFQGLMQSAIDPAIANILGLYRKVNTPREKLDYCVTAVLPFFLPENLKVMSEQIKQIARKFLFTGAFDEFMDLVDIAVVQNPKFHFGAQLFGGLVMCPNLNKKPLLNQPSNIKTNITATDLPASSAGGDVRLFVNVKLEADKPPFSIIPYKMPIAFEVERNLSGSGFKNPLIEPNDPISKIAIIPSGFVPTNADDEKHFKLKDNLQLSILKEETLQYRLRAYDFFGRPSDWGDGNTEDVPLPCHPPSVVSNLVGRVFKSEYDLLIEVYLTVDEDDLPLSATRDKLELAIHRISNNAEGEVGSITWPGQVTARYLNANINATSNLPEINTFAADCAQLEWIGSDLQWTISGSNVCDSEYPGLPAASLVLDASSNVSSATFKTYRVIACVGKWNAMSPGDYRWISRIRMKGICKDGNSVFSKESCTSQRFEIISPPPPVVQPVLNKVPYSTYGDKLGDAYYNLNLNGLFDASLSGSNPTLNIYRINLDQLTDTPDVIVDDDTFVSGGENLLLELAKRGRTRYEKINGEPIVYSDGDQFYPIKVRGDLEAFHVIGVIGCNEKLQELPWEKAAIMLFKTPLPLPAPILTLIGANSRKSNDTIINELQFSASFSQVPSAAPKIQVVRYDLNTQKKLFVGEAVGVLSDDPVVTKYSFTISDSSALSWRRYTYKGILLLPADRYGGRYIKSDQFIEKDLWTTGTFSDTPFKLVDDPVATSIPEGNLISFPFSHGDFNFSLTKEEATGAVTRWTGKILKGELFAPDGFKLLSSFSPNQYQIEYLDSDGDNAEFTLRLSSGQRFIWTKKILVS